MQLDASAPTPAAPDSSSMFGFCDTYKEVTMEKAVSVKSSSTQKILGGNIPAMALAMDRNKQNVSNFLASAKDSPVPVS